MQECGGEGGREGEGEGEGLCPLSEGAEAGAGGMGGGGEADIEDLAGVPGGGGALRGGAPGGGLLVRAGPRAGGAAGGGGGAARARAQERARARAEGVPGAGAVWVKTFGCAHNVSDGEYMAGQLAAYGFRVVQEEDRGEADVWVVNTCTVKSPSQAAMGTVLERGRREGKALVVSGCVPQGERDAPGLEGLTLLGPTQIDRVVEAVEAALRGEELRLLERKALPRLDLPKVRRNAHIEIVPLSTGCLGACTYCKTKHARGELGSYDPDALVERVRLAGRDPAVREVWLSSEDTGAYGRDIGADLSTLLLRMADALPADGRTRLRVGMTNPPFILDSLSEIAGVLRHPLVFSFLHVPVQSGSDAVLSRMNREYTAAEFRRVADALLAEVPGVNIATDIICGFPGETDLDFEDTLALVSQYRFTSCHISQFYPRPGTPAARMRKVPTKTVKSRSRAVSALVNGFDDAHANLVGTVQRVAIVEMAADGHHLVGHNKAYAQILVRPLPGIDLMGAVVHVRVTEAGRWSAIGDALPEALARAPLEPGSNSTSKITIAAQAREEGGQKGGEGVASAVRSSAGGLGRWCRLQWSLASCTRGLAALLAPRDALDWALYAGILGGATVATVACLSRRQVAGGGAA